jgi:hypothetical protein
VEARDQQKHKLIVPTASAVLDDGTIVEMVFRLDLRRTLFAIYSAGRWTLHDAIDLGPDARPFSANNNLIKNEVVLLPSEPLIYGSEARLVAEIRAFIHRYVDFGESFENVATHYVLLTWLYDAFNPARVEKEPGTDCRRFETGRRASDRCLHAPAILVLSKGRMGATPHARGSVIRRANVPRSHGVARLIFRPDRHGRPPASFAAARAVRARGEIIESELPVRGFPRCLAWFRIAVTAVRQLIEKIHLVRDV